MRNWQILDSRHVVVNQWLRLRQDTCRLPDGRMIDDYFVLEENDVGSVFALTPARELVLVEQYKHAIQSTCLELPAGFFEAQQGDPVEEARREFREETGYDAPAYHYAGRLSQSPTRMSNYIYLYVATDAYPVGTQALDDNEEITVRLVPLDRAVEMVMRGEIYAVATVAGIFMGLRYVQQLDEQSAI